MIEKPFGSDLPTAQALNACLLKVMSEKQIYRIDHYLGKETVQNILVSRFSNSLFEAFWNNHYIDHVQITAAETVGVETRGNFYEHTGALRDMVPNHLFQLLAMVAMEPPAAFGADAVRGEKAKVVGAIRPWSTEEARANSVRLIGASPTLKLASNSSAKPRAASEFRTISRAPLDATAMGFRPAKRHSGRGVLRSLPRLAENARKSAVTRAHTTCNPLSCASVLQQPSR